MVPLKISLASIYAFCVLPFSYLIIPVGCGTNFHCILYIDIIKSYSTSPQKKKRMDLKRNSLIISALSSLSQLQYFAINITNSVIQILRNLTCGKSLGRLLKRTIISLAVLFGIVSQFYILVFWLALCAMLVICKKSMLMHSLTY